MPSHRLNTLLVTLPCILTSTLVAAQNGDGGAASGNVPASATSGSVAGASGSSQGSVTMGTGAIVAIAIVVSVVVVLGILTMVLFFIAKKRQWTMRETLRRSTRRVIKTATAPLTPFRTAFSPGPLKTTFADKEIRGMRGAQKGRKNHGMMDVDLEALTGGEKHDRSHVLVSEKKVKAKPTIKIAKANEQIPLPPQTPMINKFFGRD